jgi:thermostable 8-oxoguanine DNA glycosylase
MIDPVRATDFDRSDDQLEEFLLFCIAVAGKHAGRTAINLERLLQYGRLWGNDSPFELIKTLSEKTDLAQLMKEMGFGCFNIKSRGMIQAARSCVNLRTCTVDELENLYGVGMKTARYFVLHTRRNARLACLDTHVLQWMSYYTGHDVPSKTPTKKQYLKLEESFLKIADAMQITPTDLDLKIWNKQRGSDVSEGQDELLVEVA